MIIDASQVSQDQPVTGSQRHEVGVQKISIVNAIMRALKEDNVTQMRTGGIRESATREVALALTLEEHVGVN